MRQNLTLLLLLCSLNGFAQFYVAEEAALYLENSEAILSSQELVNQIDTHITGKGTLYLNGTSNQIINSTQLVLALPNLQLANADFEQIATDHLFKYRVPSTPQARPNLTVATIHTSNLGRIVNKNYHAYFKHETPPPKAV